MVRWLLLKLAEFERYYVLKSRQNKSSWGKYLRSALFSFESQPVCRGLAIGLFWAFIPIPFQMFPALFFCWLGVGNLPIALLCVWISNPLTYLPIFYVEYQIGLLLQSGSVTATADVTLEEFANNYASTGYAIKNVYGTVLEGGIVLSIVMALLGYIIGYPLSHYLHRYARRRRK